MNRTKLNRRKNFILVAEIASRHVRAIIEGPDERPLRGKRLDRADEMILKKTRELDKQFPGDTYDVMLTRALSVNDLKKQYAEFSGWERIKVEMIQ